jgi:hypothetical protein
VKLVTTEVMGRGHEMSKEKASTADRVKGTMAAPAAGPPPAALDFLSGWREVLSGPIVQGGVLTVRYDPDRTRGCRGYHGGMPAWDLIGSIRFHPSGQSHAGNMVQHYEGVTGHVYDPPRPVPLAVPIPLDAERVELWFQNTDLLQCSAWDSRFGQNYWFGVTRQGPVQPVSPRTGAVPSLEMVNVFGSSAAKVNAFPARPSGPREGSDMQTSLTVTA